MTIFQILAGGRAICGQDLNFQLNNSIARFAVSKLMAEVANDLVKLICNRAEKLYGCADPVI